MRNISYAVSGGLTALLVIAGLTGTKNTRERLERLPLLTFLAILGSLFGPPLGMVLQQKLTTEASLGDLQIVEITQLRRSLHRVRTA